MSEDFIVRANWAWSEIRRHSDDEYRLGIGAKSADVGQVVLCDGEPLSEEDLDPIFDFMALVSQCYFVQKQYLGFKELWKALVTLTLWDTTKMRRSSWRVWLGKIRRS